MRGGGGVGLAEIECGCETCEYIFYVQIMLARSQRDSFVVVATAAAAIPKCLGKSDMLSVNVCM